MSHATMHRIAILALAAAYSVGGCPQTAGIDGGAAGDGASGGDTSPVLDYWTPGETSGTGGGTGGGGGGGGTTLVPQTFTIEPDDFEDFTDLTHFSPYLELYTTLSDNQPVELFYVTATIDGQNLAPTGQKVFGHFNIPFFYTERRLRIDFLTPAIDVSLQFSGGNPLGTEIGRMQAFDADGNLLAEYVTAPRGGNDPETMTIVRPSPQIAVVIAYVAEGEGTFGRMDELKFTIQVAQSTPTLGAR